MISSMYLLLKGHVLVVGIKNEQQYYPTRDFHKSFLLEKIGEYLNRHVGVDLRDPEEVQPSSSGGISQSRSMQKSYIQKSDNAHS